MVLHLTVGVGRSLTNETDHWRRVTFLQFIEPLSMENNIIYIYEGMLVFIIFKKYNFNFKIRSLGNALSFMIID